MANTNSMDLTATLIPTFKSVPFKMFVGCVAVAPLAVIAYTWLAQAVLSPEYAKMFLMPLYAIWGTVGSAAGIGTIWRAIQHFISATGTQQAIAVEQAKQVPQVLAPETTQ